MRAVVLRERGRSEKPQAVLTEVPVPRPRAGEITVRMAACGLCGTDIEKLSGEYTASLPILGHEAVGVVSEVGEGVEGFVEGDRVFPHHHVPCGRCHYCVGGSPTMCDQYRKTNIRPGGFSEVFTVQSEIIQGGGVLKLPDTIRYDTGTFIEPIACCIRDIDRTKIGPGQSVLVVGAGPVGLCHALLLRQMNAVVVLSDVNAKRLEFAKKLGFENLVDATNDDVSRTVRAMTDGQGADVAIVASGSPPAIRQATQATRKGGMVSLFGIPSKGAMLETGIDEIYNAEVSLVPTYGATEAETRRALGLVTKLEGELLKLITHRFPLDRFDEAVETAKAGRSTKVILESGGQPLKSRNRSGQSQVT